MTIRRRWMRLSNANKGMKSRIKKMFRGEELREGNGNCFAVYEAYLL